MRIWPSGTLENPGPGWPLGLPGSLETVGWAVRALVTEVFGFRFDYPIELVREGGSRSAPHYYIYSDRLFFNAMELDQNNIPYQRSRLFGKFYNPAYVAWYGLMMLERSLRERKERYDAFRLQFDWLMKNAVWQDDGSVVWPFPVDVTEGMCSLKAPWVSAMIQGLVLSVLVRGHRLGFGSTDLMNLCHSATGVFYKMINEGGVRSSETGWTLYEEYPSHPLPRVLDGFLFSLLGLYDLWVESENPLVKQLFKDGVAGLIHTIEFWNYKNMWSMYGSHGYLCPPHYHNLNRLLLSALATVTGETILAHYAGVWDPGRLNPLDRARLLITFISLKQWSRVTTFLRTSHA